MLDPRIYRAALVPVLVAFMVVAFSLEDRPRPIRTTLAPDAFDGARAQRELEDLVRRFPVRRPGDAGDDALSRRVELELRQAIEPAAMATVRTTHAQTIDGKRTLRTVIATRPGAPGPGLVVVAHRDAAGSPARGELSGTAALLELARVAGDGRLNRTVTFVSTSGGSGGLAGARQMARSLPASVPGGVDAVLVLGTMGASEVRKPWVVGWSNGMGTASLQLRRTVESAVHDQIGQDPGGPRALEQWAHLAFPYAAGEQGAFGRRGLPAVLLSATGEHVPDPSAQPSAAEERARLTAFGQAALRTVHALDNGPDVRGTTSAEIVTRKKVLPGWAIRLLVGALLLPFVLVTIDGFARARRRRAPVGAGLAWVLATVFAVLVTAAFAVLLRVTGLLTAAPPAPVPIGAIPVQGVALAAVAVVAVFNFAVLRRLTLRLASVSGTPEGAAAPAALLLLFAAVVLAVWVDNPFAAAFLVPAAHLWLFAVNPESPLPRPLRVLAALLSFAPFVALVVVAAHRLGLGPIDAAWQLVLLTAGGHISPLGWIVWSLALGCAISAVLAAARKRPEEDDEAEVTVRGPRTYAGPGSLGGTESALRR
jgi:hypothetical protein